MTELLMAMALGLSPSPETKPTSAAEQCKELQGYYRVVSFECKGLRATPAM
jgi:hypothetical protein